MSEKGCKILVAIKQRIENGEDPEKVIPYSVGFLNHEDYIELLYYAKQVLPEGRRKDEVSSTLERVLGEC